MLCKPILYVRIGRTDEYQPVDILFVCHPYQTIIAELMLEQPPTQFQNND